MPFQFALDAVLQYRKSLEQREYRALERVHYEITRTEGEISRVEDWLVSARNSRAAELSRGVASIQVQDAYDRELALERHRDSLQNQLRDLKLKLQQHLKTYQVARQKREVLEALRNRQLDLYTREQTKRQQNALDDLFLARRRRSQ